MGGVTCDTAKIKSSEACEGEDFIQISNMGDDDVCMNALYFDGKTIKIPQAGIGNDSPSFKLRYTMVNGKPVKSMPDGAKKAALVKPECEKRPKKSCKAIDIDHFLLDCSAEFAANEQELGSIQGKLTSMTKAVNGVKASLKPVNGKIATLTTDVNALKPVNGKIATLTKDVNALKPVNGKIATLTTDLNAVKAASKKADSNLNTKVDGANGKIAKLTKDVNALKPVNGKIATLTGRIAALEKHLDEIGGGFAAQSAPMDVLDYNNAPRDAFGGNSDLVIISLVIFNIGTVLACVSCLYWNKKAAGRVEIFDELEK